MRVTLIGKPDCHLCDDARLVVEAVCPEGFEEISVFDDPSLFDAYAELIPVVLVDGRQVAHWRITRAELRAALA